MPNSWSFDWASMATRERESLETCCVESLLVVYVLCVVLLSVIDAILPSYTISTARIRP
jgi:hypothetical protein